MFQLFFHTAILKSIQEILPLDDVLSSLKEEGKTMNDKNNCISNLQFQI